MRVVQTKLNEEQDKALNRLCEKLKETRYIFVKRAIFERMERNGSVIAKIQEWLVKDHQIVKRKA